MVCPKCKIVTTRRRVGKFVKAYCRNRACERFGQAIATVLVIQDQEQEPTDDTAEKKTTKTTAE